MSERPYTPIEAHGVVGNLQTCGLVAPDGSVDWFPFPHVESPSIFAAILDTDRGGRFRIGPVGRYESEQRYVGETNVLETAFQTPTGTATVTDFLPPAVVDHPKNVLYRKVSCLEGAVDLTVDFDPEFDYGRVPTTFSQTERGVIAEGDEHQTILESPVPLEVGDGRVTGGLALDADESEWFMLRCTGTEDAELDPQRALEATVSYWSEWGHDCDRDEGDCIFAGPWHDEVVRSSLTLKLLTHADSGAIAAAPTTSLPEDAGGVRNWDYRFNWLRDAGFTVQCLGNMGHYDQAVEYFEWFVELCETTDPPSLQPVYGLHGESIIDEVELEHFTGYRNSRPVRVGNDAAKQRQHDIYGELLVAVDEMVHRGRALDAEEWATIRDLVDYVQEIWDEPDAGIWEVRGGDRHFVYSKVMCWAALDRGIEMAMAHGDYDAPLAAWRDTRERIREDVLEHGYDEEIGAFVQAYGSDALDATALLVPFVGFLPFDDERVQGTIRAIEDRLVEDDVFVHRYDAEDGLPGEEGAFVLCSCWLVDALAMSGRVDDARERFEALLEHVPELGLVAEELDPDTGEHLGNYPQAFSHIGIINSALYLGYALGRDNDASLPMGIRLGDPVGVDAD